MNFVLGSRVITCTIELLCNLLGCLASVVGAVIQANGRTKFEDSLWKRDPLKTPNSLHRASTVPGVQQEAVCTPILLWEQPNSNLLRFPWLYVRFEVHDLVLIPGSQGVRI